MRLRVGLAILAVGVVAIGWLAQARYAPHVQEALQSRAQAAVAAAVHGVSVRVEGRDITVSGLADGPAERDALIAALDGVPGRRVVVDALEVLPLADPFALTARWQEGRLTVSGNVPTRAARAQLAEVGPDSGAEALVLAAGAPDRSWTEAALTALDALRRLESGRLTLSGRQVSVAGLALTPSEGEAVRAALDALPPGYQADLSLDFVDDGRPAAYTLHFSAETGVWVDGKLPRGVDAAALADALGVPVSAEGARRAVTGDAGSVPTALPALAPWLAELETLDLAVTTAGVELSAGVGAGADPELVRAALAAELEGQGVGAIEVVRVAAVGAEGTRRVNAATGEREELRRGYWLPVAEFQPDRETCAARTEAALAQHPIGFVTGSARLDARARRSLNALAAVMGPCLRGTGLRAEIGGHTDDTGSAEANLDLSRARAEAVRAALVARGVPAEGLSAVGYGADQPAADNATEAGRRANRRTAVRWIE